MKLFDLLVQTNKFNARSLSTYTRHAVTEYIEHQNDLIRRYCKEICYKIIGKANRICLRGYKPQRAGYFLIL